MKHTVGTLLSTHMSLVVIKYLISLTKKCSMSNKLFMVVFLPTKSFGPKNVEEKKGWKGYLHYADMPRCGKTKGQTRSQSYIEF